MSKSIDTQELEQMAETVAAMIEPKPQERYANLDSEIKKGNALWSVLAIEERHTDWIITWQLRYTPADPRFIAKVKVWLWGQKCEFSTHNNTGWVTIYVWRFKDALKRCFHKSVGITDDPATAEATALLKATVEAFK